MVVVAVHLKLMNAPATERKMIMSIVPEPREERRSSDGNKAISRITKPPAPVEIADTGLPILFLVELALKTFFQTGQLRLWDLKEQLKLPIAVIEPLVSFMRAERLCEVQQRGTGDREVSHGLTDLGRSRAQSAYKTNQYVGPAPVPLSDYIAQIDRQSVRDLRIGRQEIRHAFEGVIIAESLLDQIGPALNSEHAIFIHGPSGSGKTFAAEHLFGVLGGGVYVPYAIALDNEVIQVFDPSIHKPIAGSDKEERHLDRRYSYDERWVLCQRPVVMTGGELTLAMLDLQLDRHAHFYSAPPQLRANNGLLIIDDLGRQLVSPRDLLNRWIVPLDRRVDYLALHNGKKFQVPFDMTLIFSTNLSPDDLADAAFLRRLGYKIYVGPVDESQYKNIFRQVCSKLTVPYSDAAFDHLLHELHGKSGRPLLACYPEDIVGKARDRAFYEGSQPILSEDVLDWAWVNYFGVV